MKTIATLKKEAKQAPRFILENNGMYMSDKSKTGGEVFTADVNKAYYFNVGFDDEVRKCKAWSYSLNVLFTVKYL